MVVQTRNVIVFCAIAAIGTLGLIAEGQPTPRRKISAGAIKFSAATNPPKLQGSFRISTSPSRNAIPSNGIGGACLVADLNQFDIPRMSSGQDRKCTKNSDCNEGLRTGWSGYCDADGERTCWVRPGHGTTELCNKSVDYAPPNVWEEDTKHPSNTTPFDLSKPRYPGKLTQGKRNALESFSRAFPGPVRWRVVACLNGIDLKTQQYYPGCKDIDVAHKEMRMEVFGPIR